MNTTLAEPALDTVVTQLADEHQDRPARLAAVLEQARAIRSVSAPHDDVAVFLEPLAELRAKIEDHLLFEEASMVPSSVRGRAGRSDHRAPRPPRWRYTLESGIVIPERTLM